MNITRKMLIAYIKSQEPPLDEVYHVQEDSPFWSQFGRMRYGIGDIWEWKDLSKLDEAVLIEIADRLGRSNDLEW